LSRKEHRRYDANLERLRALEKPEPSGGMRFSTKEIGVLIVATLLALAGLFASDPRVVIPCLGVSWLTFAYICYAHPGSKSMRIVFGLAITLVFVTLMIRFHRQDLSRQQDQVYTQLSVQPFMPASRNVLRMGVTVINGGNTDIKDHTMRCWLRRVTYAPYGGISNLGMGTLPSQKFELKAHGDGETSYCMAGIQAFPPDTHAVCADITVEVSYSLVTQPNQRKVKKLRFVADGEDFVFRQQSVDDPGDYCPAPKLPQDERKPSLP
jgi:hypothetical protein